MSAGYTDIEYIQTGKIVATHGLRGEMVLKHALGKRSAFKNLKAFFIRDKAGNLIPWFPETIRIKNETENFIKLEGVSTMEEARALIQKDVWLADADFRKYAAKEAPIHLIGYSIVHDSAELGIIEEVIQQPHQVLCRLHVKGKEVLIPLHEETLKKIDAPNKKVYVALPNGLLDIYLY